MSRIKRDIKEIKDFTISRLYLKKKYPVPIIAGMFSMTEEGVRKILRASTGLKTKK